MTTRRRFLVALLPTVAVLAAAAVLMSWHTANRIRAEVVADRAVLTVGGADAVPLLDPIRFRSLTVERYSEIGFSPIRLEAADPRQYLPRERRYPDSAWTPLAPGGRVKVRPGELELRPAATLECGESGADELGLTAEPGDRVILETQGGGTFTLQLDKAQPPAAAVVTLRRPFRLMSRYGRLEGAAESPYQTASLAYRAELADHAPEVTITGLERSLILIFTLAGEPSAAVSLGGGVPARHLEFVRQGRKGYSETTLVGEGEIRFPDFPRDVDNPFQLEAGEDPHFLVLDRLRGFRLVSVSLEPARRGFHFDLEGDAGVLSAGRRGDLKDLRRTAFDDLWNHGRLTALVTIAGWLLSTTLLVYQIKKESGS